MQNFMRHTVFLSLATLFFACGKKKDVEEAVDKLRAEAPTSFQLINKNGKSYDLALTFLGDFKPGLGNLKELGCAGDVIEFKNEDGTSLIDSCQSLTLLEDLKKDEALSAAAGEGSSVYIASLAEITKEQQASFDVSPLNPENFDKSYQLIFDFKKLMADKAGFEDITAASVSVDFKTLPKIEFVQKTGKEIHLSFKEPKNAEDFLKEIKLTEGKLSCAEDAVLKVFKTSDDESCIASFSFSAVQENEKIIFTDKSTEDSYLLRFKQSSEQVSLSVDFSFEWTKTAGQYTGGQFGIGDVKQGELSTILCVTAKYRTIYEVATACRNVEANSPIKIYKAKQQLTDKELVTLTSSHKLGQCKGDCSYKLGQCNPGLRCASFVNGSTVGRKLPLSCDDKALQTNTNPINICIPKTDYVLCTPGTYSTGGESECKPKTDITACSAGQYIEYTNNNGQDVSCISE